MPKNKDKNKGARILREEANAAATKPKRRLNGVVIFIAAFVAAALLLGVVIGIISIVKHAGAVVEFNGMAMDGEVASFFVSLCKIPYLQQVRKDGADPDKEAMLVARGLVEPVREIPAEEPLVQDVRVDTRAQARLRAERSRQEREAQRAAEADSLKAN